MLGYWGDEERTAESIDRAGWMHTSDLATIDGDGYCNIVDTTVAAAQSCRAGYARLFGDARLLGR